MIVVAIDPGAGTGISTYDTVTGEFHTEEAFGFLDTCDRISWHLGTRDELQVLCESYIITARTAQLTQQYDPLMLIGVVTYECGKAGVKLTMQAPAVRKKGEAKLKTMGWFRKTKDGHSNSSSGHLLVYLLKYNLLTEADRFKLVGTL